jgi:hypothetical protein
MRRPTGALSERSATVIDDSSVAVVVRERDAILGETRGVA